jgi:hypothetical protein
MNGFPPFKPGRNYMKIGPVILIGGAVLFAAAPVLADRIPYPGSAKETSKIEASFKVVRSSIPRTDALLNAGFLPESTGSVGPLEILHANNLPDESDSKSTTVPIILLLSSLNAENHVVSLDDRGLGERTPSDAQAGKGSDQAARGSRHNSTERDRDLIRPLPASVPVPIPEPGSLWLTLLGLAAIGFSGRRRVEQGLTT